MVSTPGRDLEEQICTFSAPNLSLNLSFNVHRVLCFSIVVECRFFGGSEHFSLNSSLRSVRQKANEERNQHLI